jgi:serine/threonine-protein kinase
VLVVVAGLLVWLLLLRGHSHARTVPRVVGLRQAAAVAKLTHAGYNVTVVRAPSKRAANVVFGQRPGAGVRLGKGQTVTLDVANGSRPVVQQKPPPLSTTATTATTSASVSVPAVTGQPLAAAGGAVEAAGLVPDSYAVGSSQPAGTVVGQSPAAGASAVAGGRVRLNVSKGTGNAPTVSVPDVTGETAADARAALWNAKLTVRTVYGHAGGGQIGRVLDETGGGSTVAAYSQVTITVGR